MTKQQQKEQRQTRRLICELKKGDLKEWQSVEEDPPDMQLTFNNGTCVGMEIRCVSFADKTKKQKFEAYENWKTREEIGDFVWTKLTAKEILDSLLYSIEEKEKDLPRWSGKYAGCWLALNLDIDIPSACFQSWNTTWSPSNSDPFWNRMLIKLRDRIKTKFDAIIFCTEHWVCSINQHIHGIQPIKENIEQLAEPDTHEWCQTTVKHIEHKIPNMINESQAIGLRIQTLTKLIRPQPSA